jgi:hypothetical protein
MTSGKRCHSRIQTLPIFGNKALHETALTQERISYKHNSHRFYLFCFFYNGKVALIPALDSHRFYCEHIQHRTPCAEGREKKAFDCETLTSSLSRTQNWLSPSPLSPEILNISCLAMLSTPIPALNSKDELEWTNQTFDKEHVIYNRRRKLY